MKRCESQFDGSFVYRTIVSPTDTPDFQIEVFRSIEEMENNHTPYKVLTSIDEWIDFIE